MYICTVLYIYTIYIYTVYIYILYIYIYFRYYIYIYSYVVHVRTKQDIFASYHSGYPWASCSPKPRHLDWNRGHCDDAMSPTEVLAVHMYVSCHARAANQEINSIHGAMVLVLERNRTELLGFNNVTNIS